MGSVVAAGLWLCTVVSWSDGKEYREWNQNATEALWRAEYRCEMDNPFDDDPEWPNCVNQGCVKSQ